MAQKQTPYTAPDFSLVDSTGVRRTLAEFSGNWLVLYFYPQDDTPGCIIEACSLRDSRDDIAELGAAVVGVSRDDPSSHESFKQKHSLNFMLLCDPDVTAHKAYGAWGKKMFGQEGVLRKTFLIDPTGVVRKVYGRVNVIDHGTRVAADLRVLQEK
ncbi:peroxiredoxin [Patescibacteria group bacterium]|nr:MAG: peroxiredoxin [Patescibacteria group bacterium]